MVQLEPEYLVVLRNVVLDNVGCVFPALVRVIRVSVRATPACFYLAVQIASVPVNEVAVITIIEFKVEAIPTDFIAFVKTPPGSLGCLGASRLYVFVGTIKASRDVTRGEIAAVSCSSVAVITTLEMNVSAVSTGLIACVIPSRVSSFASKT